MNKMKINKLDLERLAYLANVIAEGHFVHGAVANESAYACAVLLREYVDRLGGVPYDSGMIDFYEMNPDFVPMMYPDDSVVQKHIAELKETREMLNSQCPPPRHGLMMMPTSSKMGLPVQMGSNSKHSIN